MAEQERASGAERLTAEVWTERDDTEVRWLGGAGFFVRARGTAVLIDPCLWAGADGRAETGFAPFYPPVLRPEEVPAGTAVLYTHSDEDHLGRKTAGALDGAVFYGPAPCARALRESGRKAERVVRPGEKFALGCIEIEAIPAEHGWQIMDPEKYGAPFGPEDCVGYILRTPHAKLLFPGDTHLTPQHMALPDDFDAMALDVSADPWHMGVRDGARLARRLSRAKLLPCHFGTYDAPEAVPHNGSLSAARAALGDAAERLVPDRIGCPVSFGRGEAENIAYREERLSAEEYIEFLKRTDLGAQYPKERFRERIEKLVRNVSISLVARNGERKIVGVLFGLTDFSYWLYVTDLGVDREYAGRGIGTHLMKTAHELAGGEKDIAVYLIANDKAVPFYRKLGMERSDDVMQYNRIEWTGFVVE